MTRHRDDPFEGLPPWAVDPPMGSVLPSAAGTSPPAARQGTHTTGSTGERGAGAPLSSWAAPYPGRGPNRAWFGCRSRRDSDSPHRRARPDRLPSRQLPSRPHLCATRVGWRRSAAGPYPAPRRNQRRLVPPCLPPGRHRGRYPYGDRDRVSHRGVG